MIITFGTTPAVQRVMEFDHFSINKVNRAQRVTELTAGKSLNAARVARTLGTEVVAITFLGGKTGQLIRDELTRSRVGLEIVEVKSPTRTCVTVVDQNARTTTELVEEPATVAPTDYQSLLDALDRRLPQAKVLICSGSFPPCAPPDLYEIAVRKASRVGVLTIVDAKANPLRAAMDAEPTVVKPNLEELAATVGHEISTEADLREAMVEIVKLGARWIVVSRGSQPVAISDGKSFFLIAVPQVHPVNPIGSGDAMAAGIAVALARGESVPQATVLGAAAAVANVLTPFAGVVQCADVDRIITQLRVRMM